MNETLLRELTKLETYTHVGSILISIMKSGVYVPEEVIDRVQGEIDFHEKLVKGLQRKK